MFEFQLSERGFNSRPKHLRSAEIADEYDFLREVSDGFSGIRMDNTSTAFFAAQL